jgi:hypothetical protein
LTGKTIGSATHTNMRFSNFVLQVDAMLHPRYELQCGSRIGWRYAQEDGGEEFRLFRDGSWLLDTCEGGGCATLASGEGTVNWENPISITMMVNGTEFAIYLNDIPVTYINTLEQRPGKDIILSLRSWGGSGFVAASLEYDNLKVWDLDKIPNLP